MSNSYTNGYFASQAFLKFPSSATSYLKIKDKMLRFKESVFAKVRKPTDHIVENNTLEKVFLHYAVADVKIINLPIHSRLWLTVYLSGKSRKVY